MTPKKKLLYSRESLTENDNSSHYHGPRHSVISPIKELGNFRGIENDDDANSPDVEAFHREIRRERAKRANPTPTVV